MATSTEEEIRQPRTTAEVVEIGVESLVESMTNPRKTFDEESLSELAESIKQYGIRQPLTVRPCSSKLVDRMAGTVTDDGSEQTYEIVIGARRYRAARKAGLASVPCMISESMPDQEAQEIQIVENLQREDIGSIEEAEGFKRLMNTHGLKVADVAARVGKSTRYVYDRLTLVSRLADEVVELAELGYLPTSHLVELARLSPKDQQKAICEVFEVYGDSAQELVAGIRSGTEDARTPSLRALKGYIERNIQHALSSASWDMTDASLTTEPACSECAFRSDRKIDQEGPIDGSDGCCMRPECFAGKKVAFIRKKVDEIKTGDAEVVAIQSDYVRDNNQIATDAGLNTPLAPHQFEKAKKSDKGAVQAIDVSTGKATWIKTGEKVAQRDDERSAQLEARKKELAKEREEVARREKLMAQVLKKLAKNNLGVVRSVVESLGWNMNRDKEASHRRVLWMAGELGNLTEDQAKDIDLHATLEDLIHDAGGELLAKLLVLWHCREDFYSHYGEPKLLNALVQVLEVDLDKESQEEEQEPEKIPATAIAASAKKARGKASKKGKKKGKRSRS